MLKKITTTIAICVILFSFVAGKSIASASSFTLTNGQFEKDSGDSEEYQLIGQDVFTTLTINVSEGGDVSGEAQVPFNFELDGDSYSGQATISLNGTYDYGNRAISGIFTYKHSRIKRHVFKSGNVAELNGSKNISKDKFSGKVDGDATTLQFIRVGSVTYTGLPPGEEKKSDDDISDLPDVEYQQGVDTGARFASIQGEVEMYPDGNPDDRRFAKMDVKIEPGIHIFTGEDSNVIITFADMSTYKLPPNSEIVIQSFKSKSQLQLLGGKLWSNFKKIINNETIEVHTSQAVLGIKGTTFIVEEQKGLTTLKVIEGTVSFQSKASGKSEDVKAGEKLVADKKGLGEKVIFDPVEEEKIWQRTEKNNRGNNKMFVYLSTGAVVGVIILGIIFNKFYSKHEKTNA